MEIMRKFSKFTSTHSSMKKEHVSQPITNTKHTEKKRLNKENNSNGA